MILIAIFTIGITTYNDIYTKNLFKEVRQKTIVINNNTINKKNEGKLILTSGFLKYDDAIEDDLFDITIKTPKLLRYVELYQWYEYKEDINGKTVYKYGKKWSDDLIDSSKFKEKGHDNPIHKLGSTTTSVPNNIKIGKFNISKELMYQIPCDKRYNIPKDISLPNGFKSTDNYITYTKDYKHPSVGDMRVSYYYSDWKKVTIIAKQSDDTFKTYTTHNNQNILKIEKGKLDLDQMIQKINNN